MSKRRPTAPESSDVGSKDQIEKTLDDALADSFPASDPVSIVTSQHEEAWHGDSGSAEGRRRASRSSRKGVSRR